MEQRLILPDTEDESVKRKIFAQICPILNPEAIVAHRNLTGSTKRGETDVEYLAAGLSDDAIPTILELVGPADRERFCYRLDKGGFLNVSASRSSATDAQRKYCPR